MFLTKIIPIVLVASTNVALVRVTFMKSRTLKAVIFPTILYNKRIKAQHRMTAMLLSISFTFVFCHAMKPFLNSRVFTTLFGPCSMKTTEYGQLRVVVLSLEMISCASNFVYFSIFHPYFLQTLKICSKCSGVRIRPLFSSTNLNGSLNGTKITHGKFKKFCAVPVRGGSMISQIGRQLQKGCQPITVLFTKPPASWFPAVPWFQLVQFLWNTKVSIGCQWELLAGTTSGGRSSQRFCRNGQ